MWRYVLGVEFFGELVGVVGDDTSLLGARKQRHRKIYNILCLTQLVI